MTTSRVLLVGPLMMREIVESLVEAQVDIEVVGSVGLDADLVHVVDCARPTIVVFVDHDPERVDPARELIMTRRQLAAVALAKDGGDTSVYELRPYRTPLGVLTPRAFLQLLRPHGARPEMS